MRVTRTPAASAATQPSSRKTHSATRCCESRQQCTHCIRSNSNIFQKDSQRNLLMRELGRSAPIHTLHPQQLNRLPERLTAQLAEADAKTRPHNVYMQVVCHPQQLRRLPMRHAVHHRSNDTTAMQPFYQRCVCISLTRLESHPANHYAWNSNLGRAHTVHIRPLTAYESKSSARCVIPSPQPPTSQAQYCILALSTTHGCQRAKLSTVSPYSPQPMAASEPSSALYPRTHPSPWLPPSQARSSIPLSGHATPYASSVCQLD